MESTVEVAWDIAGLARVAAVSARTIRYYEELGLVRPAGRGTANRRLYGPDALERLQFIARLKGLGLSLDEIRELNRSFDRGHTPAMLDDLDAMLGERLEQIEAKRHELARLQADLDRYRTHIRERRGRMTR
jgi:DNA-binding transcriptional MerR regulator